VIFKRLSIIVPVYNERATAGALLDRVLAAALPPGLEKEVVIVVGPSTDGTEAVIAGYEGRPGVSVIHEDVLRGKGAAVRTGLGGVTGDLVLIQDGDLEYRPEEYEKVLAPLLRGECDVVFGSRMLASPQQWQFRRFGGTERLYGLFVNFGGVLFTGLFNFLYGTRLTDGATMFKIFRAADLAGIVLRSDGFDYDWEIAGKLARKGLRFGEVPVSYNARSRADGKKIRFWRDGWRVLTAILRYRVAD
jgi:glycosyltransferase involved in cell wall biosynthesis